MIADRESRRILHQTVMPTFGTGGFSPDGSLFATCHPQGFVLVWDVETGRIKHRLKLGGIPTTVQFHSDGQHLLVTGSDRALYYMNFVTGQGNSGQRIEAASRLARLAIARDAARIILDGDDPSSPGPLLEAWKLQPPQPAELTTSYLLPPPNPQASELETIEWILKVGGRVYLRGINRPVLSVGDLPEGALVVEKVSFERCPIMAGEYACLLRLSPEKLELGFSQLTDQDLESIQAHLPRVLDLKIGHSQVTDAGLSLLAEHRSLGQLDVEGTRVTAAALAKVLANNSLKLMALDSRQLDAEGLLALQRRPRLSYLIIVSNNDAPVQLSRLRGAEPNALVLFGDRTTGVSPPCPDLKPLQTVTNCTTLTLQSFTFTPAQVQQLTLLRRLRNLSFVHCELPETALRQLETALPQCKVTVIP